MKKIIIVSVCIFSLIFSVPLLAQQISNEVIAYNKCILPFCFLFFIAMAFFTAGNGYGAFTVLFWTTFFGILMGLFLDTGTSLSTGSALFIMGLVGFVAGIFGLILRKLKS